MVSFDPLVGAREHGGTYHVVRTDGATGGGGVTLDAGAERVTAGPGWPAVIVTDGSGVVVHWSESAEATYGWSAAEALGRRVGELVMDPVEADAATAILAGMGAGESWEGAFQVRHRDGSTFVAHVRDTAVFDEHGAVVAVVGLSYPVGADRLPLLAAERGMRTSAERAAERLRRLQQLTAELAAALTAETVVRCVLDRGTALEGAGSGSVWLLDRERAVLRFAGATGDASERAGAFAEISLDADLPGAAVTRSGRAIYLTSRADRDARWPALAGTPTPMEALAVVPLVVAERAIGCVAFGFPEEREFGAGERDFLTALANVTAQALERTRLFEAERTASGRLAFLADASRVLNASLDYESTLHRVVVLLHERFAASVAVDVVNPDGSLDRVVATDADRLRHVTARPGTVTWEVLHGAGPRIVPDTGAGPALVVPLAARGRVVGVVYAGREPGAAAFTDEDLALARDLGARAGSAVDNARLFAARTAVAETLQRSLLPPRLPDVPGLDLAARYRPAHAGIDVGGDFYDCFAVRDGWAFVIGDVVGSGPRAAAVTTLVRHTARAVAPYVTGPDDVVRAVREAIVAGGDDEVFCTLLYGAVERVRDGMRLTIVGAGHPLPYVVRLDGRVEQVPAGGSLLGAVPVDVVPVEVLLRPGDTFVGVTDGVLEARPPRGWEDGPVFFEEDRLVEVLARTAGRPAVEVVAEVEMAVLEFADGRPRDDIAVLVLRAR